MKKIWIICLALILSLPISVFSQKKGFKNYGDSLSYSLGVEMGRQLFENMEIEEDLFNYKVFLKAFKEYYNEKDLAIHKDSASNLVNQHFIKKEAEEKLKWAKEGQSIMEKNKLMEGVIETESGLQYKILEKGMGKKPGVNDKVSVHYKGNLQDGKEFDNSYKRGTPAEFGVNQVIKGWTEALQLMHVGEKMKIWIPAELAYGERGAGNVIPSNSMLIFEVELLDIK